ncbi:MAG: hypothetical protein QM811_12615 [Pirellulales bacterium]
MLALRCGWKSVLFVASFLAVATTTLRAAPITIANPGFESNILANPTSGQPDNFIIAAGEGATITAVPGWSFTATQTSTFATYGGVSDLGVFNHAGEGALDNNIAWLFIAANKNLSSMSARQTLTASLQNSSRYTLRAGRSVGARRRTIRIGQPDVPDAGERRQHRRRFRPTVGRQRRRPDAGPLGRE